jgi:hypothetical protein
MATLVCLAVRFAISSGAMLLLLKTYLQEQKIRMNMKGNITFLEPVNFFEGKYSRIEITAIWQ